MVTVARHTLSSRTPVHSFFLYSPLETQAEYISCSFTQDSVMTQYQSNAQDSETSSQYAGIRQAEFGDQSWNRARSATLAANEGFELTDQHWHVISYLREQYLEQGLPRFAKTTARALNKQYAAQGGNKYLHNLFPGPAPPQTHTSPCPTDLFRLKRPEPLPAGDQITSRDRNRSAEDDSRRLTIMRYGSKCTLVHQAMTSDVIYRRYRNVTTKQ
jgi:tRNA 2-thiouridine synthesizing protein E